MLQNKAGLWKGEHEWNFRTKRNSDGLIYIENIVTYVSDILNINETLVLEAKDGAVTLVVDVEENKAEQLWKKGEPNAGGYFTIENSKVPKILTATPSGVLTIQGNITLRQMLQLTNCGLLTIFYITFYIQIWKENANARLDSQIVQVKIPGITT